MDKSTTNEKKEISDDGKLSNILINVNSINNLSSETNKKIHYDL